METNVPQKTEFSANNLEVVRAANYLDLKYDDLTDNNVSRKLEAVYKKYLTDGSDKPFIEYTRELNSKIGYQAGIHPLDRIYSHLTIEEKIKRDNAEKDNVLKIKSRKLELEKAVKDNQIKIEQEKQEILKKKLSIERAKARVEMERDTFKKKVEAVKKLLKEI